MKTKVIYIYTKKQYTEIETTKIYKRKLGVVSSTMFLDINCKLKFEAIEFRYYKAKNKSCTFNIKSIKFFVPYEQPKHIQFFVSNGIEVHFINAPHQLIVELL